MAYGQASAESASQAGAVDQILFYPAVLWWHGLGPVLCVVLGIAALVWIRERTQGQRPDALQNKRLALGLVWLLGGLLILMLIPKRYPRLVAPLTPAVGLMIGAWVMNRARARWIVSISGTALLGWLAWTSYRPHPAPSLVEIVDPGCIQHWIRPPMDNDLGLHAASVALQARPEGRVWVEGAPEIPCAIQTTHPWAYHLDPFLRREGMDREVVILQEGDPRPEEPPSARLVWGQAPPDVEVPILNDGFQVLGESDVPSP